MANGTAVSFSAREMEVLALAWQCMLEQPKIDFAKLADLAGYTEGSARYALGCIKKKLKTHVQNPNASSSRNNGTNGGGKGRAAGKSAAGKGGSTVRPKSTPNKSKTSASTPGSKRRRADPVEVDLTSDTVEESDGDGDENEDSDVEPVPPKKKRKVATNRMNTMNKSRARAPVQTHPVADYYDSYSQSQVDAYGNGNRYGSSTSNGNVYTYNNAADDDDNMDDTTDVKVKLEDYEFEYGYGDCGDEEYEM